MFVRHINDGISKFKGLLPYTYTSYLIQNSMISYT